MSQKNGTAEKSKDLISKANKVVSLKTLYFVFLVLVVIIIGFISKNIYFTKIDEYKDDIYLNVNQNITDKFEVMLHEKINTSILISSSLSKNISIKKALISNSATSLDMSKLLDEMKTSKEYADIQAELIDSDGISFKRSWTHLSGDDLVKNDSEMAHLIKYPRVLTDIIPTKYGLTISNKIPIFEKEEFLGLFGVNIHFDALVDIFEKDGFKTVILLNKDASKNIIQDLSYSKKFVGECYVVNSNADDYLVKIIKNNLLEYCDTPWEKEFMINESTDHLVSNYNIKDTKGMVIARAIIFKPIEQIDFEDLEFLKKAHIIATILLILLIAFVINYLYIVRSVKKLKFENEELVHVNNDLQTKTDEMDFNDKKLDNMFNMQPNLMFMHNGREVTKVNKRFMGFFNRFGTFDGFRKKHKCVSELFEKYEAPNYIWEERIENEFWIEYMLNNPRRLYKTVMSINGDPHHFIIKFNEMEYAQHVTERVIIVALVDMTQDLVNYKTLDEATKVLDMLGGKLELKEEKQNTDISYELQEQIANAVSRLTKKEVKEKSITKADTQGLKGQSIIKVQGTLKFSDVESDWLFFVPAVTSSTLLNTMMGNPKERADGNITKDSIDTSREFISIVSTKLCNEINEKGFHDLKDARYTESTVHELNLEEMEKLSNLYKIDIELEDNLKVSFFTTLLDDIIPFLNQMANEEEIKLPPKEDKEKIKPIEISENVEKILDEIDEEKKTDQKEDLKKPEEILSEIKEEDKKENVDIKVEKKEPVSVKKEIKKIETQIVKKTEEPLSESVDIKVEKKEPVPIKKEVKKVETQIVKKAEENIEKHKKAMQLEPKILKKVQNALHIKDTKKPKSLGGDSLIQSNFIKALEPLIQSKIDSEKFFMVDKSELAGMNFIQTRNKFVVDGHKKEQNWAMLFPAQSLSLIFNHRIDDKNGKIVDKVDADLKNLLKEIFKKISNNLKSETNNKIKFSYSNVVISENFKTDKNLKLYNIGIKINDKNLPIYMYR